MARKLSFRGLIERRRLHCNASWAQLKQYLIIGLLVCGACAQAPNKATTGALTGAGLGAGLGAIVGSQRGHAGVGTAIGAAGGALGGALLGNSLDQSDQETERIREKSDRLRQTLEENRRLIEELRRRGADARDSKRGVVVNLPDVLFEFDNHRLTREAKNTIDDIADVLRGTRDRALSVEGHTDSVGTVTYNQRLSERRAQGVASELVIHGISSGRIEVRGFGEGRPIATNNTAAGRSRNRRVEVIVNNPEPR